MQKFEYLKNENNFLVDEVKSIFQNYLKVIICWIKEKQKTQVCENFIKYHCYQKQV